MVCLFVFGLCCRVSFQWLLVHLFGAHHGLCCERMLKTDMQEKELLNKVVIFVFFAHKKYSCSFITLRLSHRCHMDYFNDVLTTFLGLERGSCVAVYAGSEGEEGVMGLE